MAVISNFKPPDDDDERKGPLSKRVKVALLGKPRDISDASIFRHITLIPFLAWVGLGADGLSSLAYGPEEAFRTLGLHTYLAIALAFMMAFTVIVISMAYSRIIEEFPRGGGGYVVATKLLGERAGVASGCALLIDYVLTITTSISAAGDAFFSFLPLDTGWKVPVEIAMVLFLTTINLRGVKESIIMLLPIFLTFLLCHIVLIGVGIVAKVPEFPSTVSATSEGFSTGLGTLGAGGMLLLFLHAYSLGGGTYTGIEAVSNGLPIMREPRVQTGKRTMVYMALSLAITASGLILCYLLWNTRPQTNRTMNAVLAEQIGQLLPASGAFVVLTLLSEGALLMVAAQAGFLAGPQVLANMAIDSWMPRRFAALSERLTTQNGILLMGGCALAALLYTRGNTHQLVVMYSINVFLTFSLSTFAMLRAWYRRRGRPQRRTRLVLFAVSFGLSATILIVTVYEKFPEGGWITLCSTGTLVLLCFLIRGHYRRVARKLRDQFAELETAVATDGRMPVKPDSAQRTAAILVAGYGGIGIHTVLNIFRMFPGDYKNLIFLSVGVIDSGTFKGEDEVEGLKKKTEDMLRKYLALAAGLGVAADYRMAMGADVVAEAEKLCLDLVKGFPKTTFFIGKVIFENEGWHHRVLHNETAYSIQKRLEWAGIPMVILPAKVR